MQLYQQNFKQVIEKMTQFFWEEPNNAYFLSLLSEKFNGPKNCRNSKSRY